MTEMGYSPRGSSLLGAADLADVKSDFELKWLAEGKAVKHLTWRKLPLPPHTVGH